MRSTAMIVPEVVVPPRARGWASDRRTLQRCRELHPASAGMDAGNMRLGASSWWSIVFQARQCRDQTPARPALLDVTPACVCAAGGRPGRLTATSRRSSIAWLRAAARSTNTRGSWAALGRTGTQSRPTRASPTTRGARSANAPTTRRMSAAAGRSGGRGNASGGAPKTTSGDIGNWPRPAGARAVGARGITAAKRALRVDPLVATLPPRAASDIGNSRRPAGAPAVGARGTATA